METKKPDPNNHFIPARPSDFVIKAAQAVIRAQLAMTNKVIIDEEDLNRLRALPKDAGLVLVSNHADEMDPRVCLDLARRCGKRFMIMCNREAFNENFGLAGKALQSLGYFSVNRGAHDITAKDYAVDLVKAGKDVLVMFPEGEIFYLNEVIQRFHAGAISIAMDAVVAQRKANPNWSAYLIPMAIKYHYPESIEDILSRRMTRMETRLSLPKMDGTLIERLHRIQQTLLHREQKTYGINLDLTTESDLGQEITQTQEALLQMIEEKHQKKLLSQKNLIDQSWQLGAELREMNFPQKMKELDDLKLIEHMVSWRPGYYGTGNSQDRIAEALLKQERDLYKIKRPQQLANRNVYVKIAEPTNLGTFADQYQTDAHGLLSNVTSTLHDQIQSMIDELVRVISK
ncbi:1-acyl-sn-glycerol-3-phosphate acyltransferase [bacterium]|nr:1-acyl-sn-glycerol-3-phosphate acyltransferase [bacterium]QQR56433.1 MAG: 1-acyl-sn-glycerol-3-phosphate acyltransferase [Candidatus Melainabacteria bacterium]